MQKEAGILLAVVVGVLLLIASLNEEEPQACPDGSCPIQLVESLADVPPLLRQPNWSPYGFGSCVHASTITMLRYRGEFEMADWWRATYSSGEYADRLIKRMESAGLRFAYTDDGDVDFLEWASRNRLVAGIFYFPRHAVNLVDLNQNEAVLIDNNRPNEYIRIPREEFLREWKKFGGFAWVILNGSNPPPWPTW